MPDLIPLSSRVCPFSRGPCMGRVCAWWNEDMCSVRAIALRR